ncbi:LysR family transcriptional regulator [Cobetia sp. UCD-24C]|uniref:LysR family transcriptional regulator n=1 Tax=Cobetia sp. UCD-24C TaxID=1716176 RepID=UPI0006CA37E5|nr:LysR family transcriptional regulator [Cobetia sp. UCD-24C]KPM75562.1 LysR family transcriptional regulator [Cobetia sp. UCD-24C]
MRSRSDDLELLLAVVDSGGFSAAANRLNIPVAKVSRAIQRLEGELETPLLNRTTRSVALTDEGRGFVERVREGLLLLGSAEEALLQQRAQPSGRLRVDAASPFVLHQLVPLVAEFSRSYPGIALELSAADDIINLLEQRTDVAIRIGELDDSTLHAKVLGRSTLHLVASPAYLAEHGVPSSVAALQTHQLLGFLPPSRLNRWPLKGSAQGFDTTPHLPTTSGEVMRQLCLAGHGIALISRFMLGNDLKTGALVEVLPGQIQSPNPREQIQAVYYRNSTLSPRISAFVEFLATRLTL